MNAQGTPSEMQQILKRAWQTAHSNGCAQITSVHILGSIVGGDDGIRQILHRHASDWAAFEDIISKSTGCIDQPWTEATNIPLTEEAEKIILDIRRGGDAVDARSLLASMIATPSCSAAGILGKFFDVNALSRELG
jgi:ATP-dependent Clp protease ATP-binding subunit ClpA